MKKLKKATSDNKGHGLRSPRLLVFIAILFIIVPVALYLLIYNLSYAGRVFPNIYIAGYHIGGLTTEEASQILADKIKSPSSINLTADSKLFTINLDTVEFSYDFNESVLRAYNLTRTSNFFYDTLNRFRLLSNPTNLGLKVNINENLLTDEIASIAEVVSLKPINPSIKIVDRAIGVEKGQAGNTIDNAVLRSLIAEELSKSDIKTIEIPLKTIDTSLSPDEAEIVKIRASRFLGKRIILKFEYSEFKLTDTDLIKMLNPRNGYDEGEINLKIAKIADSVNRDPQNPKFQFDGSKVTEFAPALDGVKTDNLKLKTGLTDMLVKFETEENAEQTIAIPVTRTKPDISTGEVNNLGIKELIGRGTSTYFHSIPGRVFNVNLAASRVNGALIKPGETFSFNQTLGDVSKLTGYKEAYIISGGKTILGDGGGVCQVSTTLFRAVLNAGLPIDERNAHAYRVGYYEQNSPPGLDATVFSPRPDFKFTNNTNGHILIQAKNDPKNFSLIFEIYGTSDGRVSHLSKPVITNYSPPPPTVYQDDPTLPAGTIKQTEYAASGAKVTFNYSVTKNGQEIYKKTFISNYRPWASVFLRGTGPAQ